LIEATPPEQRDRRFACSTDSLGLTYWYEMENGERQAREALTVNLY